MRIMLQSQYQLLQIQKNKMLETFWSKQIVVQISINPEDVADDLLPLPLFISMKWNHYMAFYHEQITQYFKSWIPYPYQKEQFHLKLVVNQNQQVQLNGTQIIGHLVTLYQVGLYQPLQILCNFRKCISSLQKHSIFPQHLIEIKKHYKNTLKASTCIRNGRYGASILTVQMSIQNVEKMYQNYIKSDLEGYFGSDDFDSQDLGYKFLISKSQKLPVKVIGKDWCVERGVDKNYIMLEFLNSLFCGCVEKRKVQELAQKEQVSQNNEQNNKNEKIQQNEQKNKQQNQQSQIVQKFNQIQNQNQKQPQKLCTKCLNGIRLYLQGIQLITPNDNSKNLQSNKLGLILKNKASYFEKYCQPDGYLYFLVKEQ